MILDKCLDYVSQEEKEHFLTLLDEYRTIAKIKIVPERLPYKQTDTGEQNGNYIYDFTNDKDNRHIDLKAELSELLRDFQQRYINAVKDNTKQIIDDARAIADSITRADYTEFLQNPDVYLDFIPAAHGALVMGRFKDNKESIILFFFVKCYLQTRAFEMRNEDNTPITLLALKGAYDLGYLDDVGNETEKEAFKTLFDKDNFENLIYSPEIRIKKLEEVEIQISDPQAAGNEKKDDKANKNIDIINFFEQGVNALEYPIDKINNSIWNEFIIAAAKPNEAGQITFAMETKGDKPINLLYAIDFSNLEETGVTITKKLTAFDKRVYIACGALYSAGYEIITIGQIYKTMGNNGNPSATAIKKINDSLTKMRGAIIFVDNEQESNAYNYPRFRYDDSLLPMARITAIINGQETDSAIKLHCEPPLQSFAKQRKQVTTVKRELLASPINKTEQNLLIDDYLIEQIAQIKTGRRSNRILFETLFKATGIKDRRIKPRKKKDILEKLLPHYKAQGFIKDFAADNDGITITY